MHAAAFFQDVHGRIVAFSRKVKTRAEFEEWLSAIKIECRVRRLTYRGSWLKRKTR